MNDLIPIILEYAISIPSKLHSTSNAYYAFWFLDSKKIPCEIIALTTYRNLRLTCKLFRNIIDQQANYPGWSGLALEWTRIGCIIGLDRDLFRGEIESAASTIPVRLTPVLMEFCRRNVRKVSCFRNRYQDSLNQIYNVRYTWRILSDMKEWMWSYVIVDQTHWICDRNGWGLFLLDSGKTGWCGIPRWNLIIRRKDEDIKFIAVTCDCRYPKIHQLLPKQMKFRDLVKEEAVMYP